MLERRIDEFWNINGKRELSDSWTGYTRITVLLQEKHPNGKTWSGGRLTKKQNDIQARLFVAKNVERHVRSTATKRKTEVDYRETEA